MNNNLLRIKLKQRLNKLSSNDFTNLECWQEAELINKAQLQVVRRNLHGGNIYKEGNEQSLFRVDDFQILLVEKELKLIDKDFYYESAQTIPDNYLLYKRLSVKAGILSCDEKRNMRVQLREEANVDELLADVFLRPSFKWGETFATIIGNKIRIYTNNDFHIVSSKLTYYRYPKVVSFDGCRDLDNNVLSDEELEFKDDLAEIIIDEAVKIAAGDMNDFNNVSRITGNIVENN